MGVYRSFFVWGGGIVLVLGLFLILMATGWPGDPDSCLHLADHARNTCYCEAYKVADVLAHAPGVRQKANTWYNLYAIGTSLLVAIYLWCDRRNGITGNIMRSRNLIADVYVFAVLFLGLGSMWFHAALTTRVDWMDGFSMYVFVCFLVWYTIFRLFRYPLIFWIGYPIFVLVFTVVGALWKYDNASLVLININVGLYLIAETLVCIFVTQNFLLGRAKTIGLWWGGAGSIGLATLFWQLSKTGGVLCDPASPLQPHGLLWHPLAGVTAVLLYFYWREEPDDGHTYGLFLRDD
jgi:hypothetical protein